VNWSQLSWEIVGQTATPFSLAQTFVNRAWQQIQREFLWSFLWSDVAIPTPQWVTTGTVTVTIGSTSVTADATAKAAWNAFGTAIPIHTRQFRVGQGTIYNIASYNPGTGVATLDRPYVDPTAGAGTSYTILKCFYEAPSQDFVWWESIVDPNTGYTFQTELTKEQVDEIDPQRLNLGWPVGVDPRGIIGYGSAAPAGFLGYPQYEIWPAPTAGYTYVGSCFRSGMPFVNQTDSPPFQITDDVVIALAKVYAYEYAEAHLDSLPVERRKVDFRYLIGAAAKQYQILLSGLIYKDEAGTKRHVIKSPNMGYVSTVPWVSARLMTATFPD
jgi:hypothetical protein